MNQVFLTGRLTKDVELRYTNNQKAVASFTVAVDRDYTTQNNERPTDFLNCRAWGKTAEKLKELFFKGKKILIQGSIYIEKWEDNKIKQRQSTIINVSRWEFADDKRQDGYSGGQGSGYGGNNGRSSNGSQRQPDPGMPPVEQLDTFGDDGFGEEDIPF